MGRVTRTTVRAELAIPNIVKHDHEDVRRAFGCLKRQCRSPVGGRILVGLTDFAREIWNWYRQYGPVLRRSERRKGSTQGRHDDCCPKQQGSSPHAHESLLSTVPPFLH